MNLARSMYRSVDILSLNDVSVGAVMKVGDDV